MSVVIDEIISEPAAAPPAAAAAAETPATAAQLPDLERLDHELRRRRHRAERLWAD